MIAPYPIAILKIFVRPIWAEPCPKLACILLSQTTKLSIIVGLGLDGVIDPNLLEWNGLVKSRIPQGWTIVLAHNMPSFICFGLIEALINILDVDICY